VHVRVRPLSEQEKEKGGKAWSVESNTIRQIDTASGALAGDVAPYTLDTVFDGACSTAQVYERTTRGLIKQVVEGFNSTVFAYGQTSSGKTHTMRGTADDPGLVPRAVKEIFDLINSNKEREYLLRVSYMEVRAQCICRFRRRSGVSFVSLAPCYPQLYHMTLFISCDAFLNPLIYLFAALQ